MKDDLSALPGTWFERIQQQSIRGTPDRIGCIRSRFVALETKVVGGKIGALQHYKADLARAAGGRVYFIDPENWDEVYEELRILSYLENL